MLDACPDAQWRLLFALSRYAGLRCPSEHLALRWADIDWAANKMTVHSPKTEHHAGKDKRVIPIFPELLPYLKDAFDPEEEFVISRYRDANANLRTQLIRIIRKAGLEPWPKLFQNLRATRETELAELFPSHVVCEWIGHTREVARKHYLQVTEDHFAKAVSVAENPQHTSSALQFAMQKYGEKPCNSVQAKKEQVDASADTSAVCINLHSNESLYSGRTQKRKNPLFLGKTRVFKNRWATIWVSP